MAATIPPEKYGDAVFSPKQGYNRASVDNLDKMKFDGLHYVRMYTQCRGRGASQAECSKALPTDGHRAPSVSTCYSSSV